MQEQIETPRLDTLAEIQRLCSHVSSSETDIQEFMLSVKRAEDDEGKINHIIRIMREDKFQICSNLLRTYYLVNTSGSCSLYKLRK